MKKRKTSILLWSVAMISSLSVVSSCIKSADNLDPAPAKAYVSIMHLAPTAPSLDVFFNQTKVSSAPFAPGNVTVAYNAIDKGAFPITFKKASSDSVVASITFAQYDSLNFYTLFIYNQHANGPVNAVRIRDDFSKLTQTKSFYRFFHASPNTNAVDLYMDNVKIESGRVLADNTSSGVLNEFTGVSSGYHTFQAKPAGMDTVIASLDNVELLTGNAYTFYLRGLTGGTSSSQLSLGLLRAIN